VTRIISGCLCVSLGLLFLVGYEAEDYRPGNTYEAETVEEAARIHQANTELDREHDFHRISIVMLLILGPLMIADGVWRRRRGRELKRRAEESREVDP